jgi:Beta-lactamase class C and other penicillin binding proteins
MKTFKLTVCLCLLFSLVYAQNKDIQKKLRPFDKEMEKIMKDWNIPGVGVGIVKDGKLVFVKGYGYRDYAKKLPITENTLFQIASNTKQFTATAVGFFGRRRKTGMG